MLGGGCFWCLEAVFDRLRGVHSVESGYAGGQPPNPTYEDVCSGEPGTPRSCASASIRPCCRFRDLLRVFFAIHDPTTKDRQGNDVGTQYRSVIFARARAARRTRKA